MNKRTKKLLIGIVILILAAAAYFAVSALTNKDDGEIDEPQDKITLISLDAGDIVKIKYTYNSETMSFTNKDGEWIYDTDAEFPLKQSYLADMADQTAGLSALRKLEAENINYSEYGLDIPSAEIYATDTSDNTYALKVGSYNSYGDGGYYLEYKGDVYLISDGLPDAYFHSLYSLLPTTSVPGIKSENVTSLSINGTEIDDPDEMTDIFNKFISMISTEVADYKNKESYGFDGSEMNITVNYTEESETEEGSTDEPIKTEKTYTFLLSKDVGGKRYAMHPDDGLIYVCNYYEDFISAVPE